jgi:uncharacterized membrane protein YqjE
MSDPSTEASGWLESFRGIGESLLAMLRNRLELFGVELQEEKLRLLNLLLWIGLAAALGFAGVFVIIVALAFLLWNAAGYAGLVLLAVLSLGAAAAIVAGLRKKIQTGPPPFSHTVAEFRKDGACWRKNK